jgi:hypothetical protein
MYAHSLKIGKPHHLKVFGASKPMIVAKTAVLTSYQGELTLVLINYIMLKL